MLTRIVIFIILNFGALGIGASLMGDAVLSDWYNELNKAPWTPPGWMFGFAWTLIMISFSVYMAFLWKYNNNKKLVIGLYLLQWVLNVSWNPLFFNLHYITLALADIVLLTFIVGYFSFHYWADLKGKSILIFPYLVWILIATSLNGYIFLYN